MSNDLVPLEQNLELKDLSPLITAELAAGLSDAKTIRDRYGLSKAQWDILKATPAFRSMLADAVKKWRGDLNAGARITLKAETLLEDAMPEMYHIIKSPLAQNADKINAIKQLTELAGRTAKSAPDGKTSPGGFVLNINVGKGQGVTIQGEKVDENG